MKLPNFVVIGAAKAGTTSLQGYLGQHPDVFMCPVSEPAYFVFSSGPQDGRFRRDAPFITDSDDYAELFSLVGSESAIGEASTHYLQYSWSAPRINAGLPGSRAIAVLRHPVERAYSQYVMNLRDGIELGGSFEAIVEQEKVLVAQGKREQSGIVGSSLYSEGIAAFLKTFGRDRLGIWLYDDLRDRPVETLQEMFRFLGVNDGFVPDMSGRRNAGGVHRSRIVATVFNRPNPIRAAARRLLAPAVRERLRDKVRSLSVTKAPRLDAATGAALLDYFRPDIAELQPLIERDLGRWLAP